MRLGIVGWLYRDAETGVSDIWIVFLMGHRQRAGADIFVYLRGIRVLGGCRIGY